MVNTDMPIMVALIRFNQAILYDRLGMHLRLPSIVTGMFIYTFGLADYWRRYSELQSTNHVLLTTRRASFSGYLKSSNS